MLDRIKKRHLVFLVLFALLATASIIYFANDASKPGNTIRRYEQEKDFQALVPVIKENMFWLSERPDFSPEKFLIWRAPNFDPARKGEATIDIIEVDKETAGFISYYKKSPTQGFIWLLAVDEKFRRRGLGEQLLAHALNQLKKQGAQYVILYTRLHKTPAMGLYQKAGFVEHSREEERGLITLIKKFP